VTDDLVSRLLAAIQERERPELAARGDHNLAWTLSGETTDQVHARCLYCDWTREGPEHEVDPQADEHTRSCTGMPPSEVLRLCQAHRQIVHRYEHAWKRSKDAPEAERMLWQAQTIALIDVIHWLAEGYDVEASP